MSIKLGVIMDPIQNIHIQKDTTFALLLAAQKQQWQIYYMDQSHLFLRDGECFSKMHALQVQDNPTHWFDCDTAITQSLSNLDVILMRKDPPVDINYIYTTYLLEQAERQGVLVVNKPQSLRDANEKLFACRFPQCMVPTLVSANVTQLQQFIQEHQHIIVKPLDGMGGRSIFKLTPNDPNTTGILDSMTAQGERLVMMQRFIPQVSQGDKRILMIDGEPVPYALQRIPKAGEIRANLAAGGSGVGTELTARDRWICNEIAPTLRQLGLFFVGIDVIGDYLTEINVTSPTCVREIEKHFQIDICQQILDCIEKKLQ